MDGAGLAGCPDIRNRNTTMVAAATQKKKERRKSTACFALNNTLFQNNYTHIVHTYILHILNCGGTSSSCCSRRRSIIYIICSVVFLLLQGSVSARADPIPHITHATTPPFSISTAIKITKTMTAAYVRNSGGQLSHSLRHSGLHSHPATLHPLSHTHRHTYASCTYK